MGMKLDALFGRNHKATKKIKTLAKLAVSRIALLKNQHHVRCSHALSDVVQLLTLGHHERALLRVEHLIEEQNMLDAFVMIENYCHLLQEKAMLLEKTKECPDELNEAISSLIFAAPRCGEFPELQEIRGILTSKFGKEFANRAVELRNNCRVNRKIIQKLSTKQADLESRQKILKQIAFDNGITLLLGETEDFNKQQKYSHPNEVGGSEEGPELGTVVMRDVSEVLTRHEKFSDSMKTRENKYVDVATAAQVAFESAAYAAAAARAAVELSRSESGDPKLTKLERNHLGTDEPSDLAGRAMQKTWK